MGIWYIGGPELPDRIKPVVDKARDVGATVGEIALKTTELSLRVQSPINPFAKKLLEAYFESPDPDPTDIYAEGQYPPQGEAG